ncbi:MAG: hypothetical protein NUW37_12575 [Planctomycetes bacterium]|nr:hypothetical protein [Planctomycetota bacterium]
MRVLTAIAVLCTAAGIYFALQKDEPWWEDVELKTIEAEYEPLKAELLYVNEALAQRRTAFTRGARRMEPGDPMINALAGEIQSLEKRSEQLIGNVNDLLDKAKRRCDQLRVETRHVDALIRRWDHHAESLRANPEFISGLEN